MDELQLLKERILYWFSGGEWKELDEAIHLTSANNPYFSEFMQKHALKAIVEEFLDSEKLGNWALTSKNKWSRSPRIGIVMAGNIPLVGFSDLLAVLISNAIPIIKLSSKDPFLLPILLPNLNYVKELDEDRIDAVITMGSDTSAKIFQNLYANIPKLIRGSRFSLAVISGNEKDEELDALAEDILLYYGMGCRSVSMIFVPKGYDFTRLGLRLNNYIDSNSLGLMNGSYMRFKAILTMEKKKYYDTGKFLLYESLLDSVPLGAIRYWEYESLDFIKKFEVENLHKIQKIFYNFGIAQKPNLLDYPDGIDVLKFINNYDI